MYYLHEQQIPRETESVMRRLCARTEEEKQAVLSVLDEFFFLTENGYVHSRCDAEIALYQGKAGQARSNGKLGGRPKKTESEPEKNQSGFQEKPNEKLTTNHKPLTTNHKPRTTPVPPTATPTGFAEFWAAYPKKVGKDAALRAWKKIKSPASVLQNILLSLAWQVKSDQWVRDGGQYIPNPATYLTQGRWQDEPVGVDVKTKPSQDSFFDIDYGNEVTEL